MNRNQNDSPNSCVARIVCPSGRNCELKIDNNVSVDGPPVMVEAIAFPINAYRDLGVSMQEECKIIKSSIQWEEQHALDFIRNIGLEFPEFAPNQSADFIVPAGRYRPKIRYMLKDSNGSHACECWGEVFELEQNLHLIQVNELN